MDDARTTRRLIDALGADRPLVLEADGRVGSASIGAEAWALSKHLSDPSPGSEVLMGFDADAHALCVAVFAAWMRGHAAALPTTATRPSLAPLLEREQNAGFLHDTASGRETHVRRWLSSAHDTPAFPSAARIVPAMRGFKDGQATPEFDRTWSEIADRADQWSRRLRLGSDSRVAVAASPTSDAATTIALVASLLCGGAWCADRDATAWLEPGALAEDAPDVLIASAAQLRRLARSSRLELGAIAHVVSADEPLDLRTVEAFSRAKRVECHDFVVDPDERYARLRDAILAVEGVADAHFEVTLQGGAAHVLLAVAPHAAVASEPLGELVRRSFGPSATFDVEQCDELPRDARGALRCGAWKRLFGVGARGDRLSRRLTLREDPSNGDNENVRRWIVSMPSNYHLFEGHFPGYPVLPGAGQLAKIVAPALGKAWPGMEDVARWKAVKFTARILPGDEITLTLRVNADRTGGSFVLAHGETNCTTGAFEVRRTGD